MKTTIIFLLLLICTSSFSQHCNFSGKQTTDPYTGFPIISQGDGFPISKQFKLYFRTNHCWIQLVAKYTRGWCPAEITFNTKTPIKVEFDDKSFLILLPTNDYKISAIVNGSERTDFAIYPVSRENVELL